MYAVSFFETFYWIMLKMELKYHIFEKISSIWQNWGLLIEVLSIEMWQNLASCALWNDIASKSCRYLGFFKSLINFAFGRNLLKTLKMTTDNKNKRPPVSNGSIDNILIYILK